MRTLRRDYIDGWRPFLALHAAYIACVIFGAFFMRGQQGLASDGVDMSPHRGEDIGLAGMREQLLSLDGTLRITLAPSQGTIIEAAS